MKSRELIQAYHYTCDHGAQGIRRDGLIKTNPHPWLPIPLAWFTDLDAPIRDALGLTSQILTCDRTEHRFEASPHGLLWWPIYARELSAEIRWGLESAPGALPMHWWISDRDVPVRQPEAVAS